MSGKLRRVSDETVRTLAEYAGLDLPAERVPLLRAQLENVLNFTKQWEEHLDLPNTRPAHVYRIPREVPDPLATPQRRG